MTSSLRQYSIELAMPASTASFPIPSLYTVETRYWLVLLNRVQKCLPQVCKPLKREQVNKSHIHRRPKPFLYFQVVHVEKRTEKASSKKPQA